MSSVLIACGGTGGHLAPGIALAEALITRGHRVHLLISEKPVDARLVAKYPHLRVTPIPAAPFAANPAALARFFLRQTKGVFFCLKMIRQMRPQLVVGFGGFGTASVVLAASLLRIPVALHEANHVPGRAIRLLGAVARRVYLPRGVVLSGLAAQRIRGQGLPVRAEFLPSDRSAARAELDLDPSENVLVVLGGSQGATPLNAWTRSHLERLAAEGIQIFCVAGPGKSEPEHFEFRSKRGSKIVSKIIPFSDKMATLLSAADLVVSRAGAGTIAELARCGTPAILIPYPHAADNHQEANARAFVESGCGLSLDQTKLDTLFETVCGVLSDAEMRARFRANLGKRDRENALEPMLEDLEALMREDALAAERSMTRFAA